MARPVRWGHLREIKHVRRVFDGRYKKPVQTVAFRNLQNRLKHLSSHRRTHMFPGGHGVPHKRAQVVGVGSAANLNLRKKLNLIADREGKAS